MNSEANHQVNKPRDTQTQLQEQKVIREALGHVQSAVSTYTARGDIINRLMSIY